MLTLAINDPEFCDARQESGHDPWVSYHIVDDPLNATFAAVSFGTAGLRIFDIRRPITPVEVAVDGNAVPGLFIVSAIVNNLELAGKQAETLFRDNGSAEWTWR